MIANFMNGQKTSSEDIHSIKVRLADGSILEGEIRSFSRYRTDTNMGASCLELHLGKSGVFYAEAHNYFDAMIALRNELEPQGVQLLCFGARRDSWASGMQRDMGAGLVAYLLSSPDQENLVQQSIFDYASPETIGTTAEQQQYAKAWISERSSSDKK